MTDGLVLMVVLLGAHYVADFEAQTDWMAVNKSKSWEALWSHVLVYASLMALAFLVHLEVVVGVDESALRRTWHFWSFTALTHFATDAVTSRWTTKLYGDGPWPSDRVMKYLRPGPGAPPYIEYRPFQRHRFFCVIGLDQYIHACTLAATAWWVLR